jgi:UDP-N-acetylmuramate dehydrogenase
VTAAGGYTLSKLIQLMGENGLGGLENLAGIPGTVGGAVAGNAGAYGTAIGEKIKSVLILTREGKIRKFEQKELEFSYRSSALKKTGDVVLEATFSTNRRDPSELTKIIESRLSDRSSKHPDWKTIATAGSYFKNPIAADGTRIAAGRLLEEAGCKGLRVGGAHLWHKHANIIVTDGNAKASDVKKLADMMSKRVTERFNITLSPEVVYLE